MTTPQDWKMMSLEQLRDQLARMRREQAALRVKRAMGQLDDVWALRRVRRNAARLLTFIRNRSREKGREDA